MGRKEFTAIAKAVNGWLASADVSALDAATLVSGIADVFAEANERFDRAKFYDACLKGSS